MTVILSSISQTCFGPKEPMGGGGGPNDPCQDDWRIVQLDLVRFFDHHSWVFGSLSWCISLFMYSFSLLAAYSHSPSYTIIHPLWYVQVKPTGDKTTIQSINQSTTITQGRSTRVVHIAISLLLARDIMVWHAECALQIEHHQWCLKWNGLF